MTAERSRKSQSYPGWTLGFIVLIAWGSRLAAAGWRSSHFSSALFLTDKTPPAATQITPGHPAPPKSISHRLPPHPLPRRRPRRVPARLPGGAGGPGRQREGGREGRPTAPLTDLGEGSQEDPEGDLEGDLHVGVVQGKDVEPRLLEGSAAGARRGAGAHRRGAGRLALRGGPRLRRPGRQHGQHRQQHSQQHWQQRRGRAPGAAAAPHGVPAPGPVRRCPTAPLWPPPPPSRRRGHLPLPRPRRLRLLPGDWASPDSAPPAGSGSPLPPGRPRGRPRRAKPRARPAAAGRPRAPGPGDRCRTPRERPSGGQIPAAGTGCGAAWQQRAVRRSTPVIRHTSTNSCSPVPAEENRLEKVSMKPESVVSSKVL